MFRFQVVTLNVCNTFSQRSRVGTVIFIPTVSINLVNANKYFLAKTGRASVNPLLG